MKPLRPLRKVEPTDVRSYNSARGVALGLDPRLLAWVWSRAESLSEGSVYTLGAHTTYQGSTMISFDLAPLVAELGPRDRLKLFDSLRKSVDLRLRAMRLAVSESARRSLGHRLGRPSIDTRTRVEGPTLFFDLDVEAVASEAPAIAVGGASVDSMDEANDTFAVPCDRANRDSNGVFQ